MTETEQKMIDWCIHFAETGQHKCSIVKLVGEHQDERKSNGGISFTHIGESVAIYPVTHK